MVHVLVHVFPVSRGLVLKMYFREKPQTESFNIIIWSLSIFFKTVSPFVSKAYKEAKKPHILEFVLFAFTMDDIGKFTMDKWWLPRFSFQKRDPSFLQ